jgi:hypothetical protein
MYNARNNSDRTARFVVAPALPRTWAERLRTACCVACLISFAFAARPAQVDEADPNQRDLAGKQAVILWIGLGILSVLTVGIGLIWGVSRGARHLLRKRPPTHTEMQNIWYLNPPGKRRQDDS